MASINPETGMTTYFKPMGTGYFKVFGTETSSFWCCTGTGMENFTKLNDSIYFHTESDLYVNLYLSSVLNWEGKGLVVSQSADIPNSDTVTFTIVEAPADQMNIKFRVPEWIADSQAVRVRLNGQEYVLDNLATAPIPADMVFQYKPYYAVNAQYRWVFVQPIKP